QSILLDTFLLCKEVSTSMTTTFPTIEIHRGDNLEVIRSFPDATFDLIYIDPPFNTGKTQSRTQLKTIRDEDGDRVGFQGHRYKTIRVGSKSYVDKFDDYLAYLEPRLV